MMLSVGLGVAALIAATWGAFNRARAGRVSDELARVRAEAEGQRRAIEQSEADLSEAREALTRREAQLEHARAVSLEVAREHEAALEKLRGQALGLRRTLAAVGAERDRLAQRASEQEEEVAAANAVQAERAALQGRLQAAESELARLRGETARTPTRAWIQRLGELERSVEAANNERAQWERRAEDAERALESLGSTSMSAEREALLTRVQRLEETAARSARARAAVASLGLPELPRDARILSGERRGHTEAVLRETYIATQSAAGAILDRRGAPWARCGNAGVLERLSASSVLLRAAPIHAALGQPARLCSELYGVYGRHLVTLPGTDLALAMTGSRECPALPLRLAALRLVGPSEPARAEAEAQAPLALDPERSERLDAWAVRRGATGVAAFGHGDPAGTDSGFAAACALAVPAVQNLFRRALRDGFAQGFAVLWRAETDETLAARVLDDGISVVFARFSSPPAPRVLDDLVATLRWTGLPLAAAS